MADRQFNFSAGPGVLPESVLREFNYAHPVFDRDAVQSQRDLPSIQGSRNTWFCGAWTGYGFHEDGLRSALAVANALGIRAPWQAGVTTAVRSIA